MLNKIKELGTQVATTASDAAKGISTSVKSGAESIANATVSATVSATEAINEKAVKASTAQMCTILEIAMAEIKSRPLGERPVSLTASVSFGVASLEMQIQLEPDSGAMGSVVEPEV